MLIDWFTVAAQAVNFLILAWLLKRFLYGPIIEAMGERRQRLAEEQAKAQAMREEATRRVRELSEKQEELERQAETMLGNARSETERQREQWLADAKAEVETRSKEWLEALEREQATLSDKLRTRMARQVIHVAEKALHDLAGERLEILVLEDFLIKFPEAATQIQGQVEIRTGLPISKESLDQFRQQLRARFPDCGEITASRDESLGFGIIMVSGDTKWEWNLSSYLDKVEKAVFEELAQTKAAT